jgi:hypothetical protein
MSAAAAFLWYMVIAGPQSGLVVLPSPFDNLDQCRAAITEFEKIKPAAGWTLQCAPGGPALQDEQVPEDNSPAE